MLKRGVVYICHRGALAMALLNRGILRREIQMTCKKWTVKIALVIVVLLAFCTTALAQKIGNPKAGKSVGKKLNIPTTAIGVPSQLSTTQNLGKGITGAVGTMFENSPTIVTVENEIFESATKLKEINKYVLSEEEVIVRDSLAKYMMESTTEATMLSEILKEVVEENEKKDDDDDDDNPFTGSIYKPEDPPELLILPLVYDDDDDDDDYNKYLRLIQSSDPCAPGYRGLESCVLKLLHHNRDVNQLYVR